MQLLDSKLILKQTLSKSKPRLNVLIMVCQHIQNEVLIHLVPKVLEPNIYEISGSAIDPTITGIENWAFSNSFSDLIFKNRDEATKIL